MQVINGSNVNDVYVKAVTMMRGIMKTATPLPSRAGETYEAPGAVATVYADPSRCVLWDARRDANPVFHLFEALWMLAGRNDVAFLSKFSSAIAEFVDDGNGVQHGAYGFRWRQWFGFDQLDALAEHLKADPMSRRAVLQMWDPEGDLVESTEVLNDKGLGTGSFNRRPASGKDMPCNMSIVFSTRRGVLDMIVNNRSNDIILGCYGANAVHFSILQQYMAHRLGVPVGTYTQVSFNWHTYVKTWDSKVGPIWYPSHDYYKDGVAPLPFDVGDSELRAFMQDPGETGAYESSFMTLVVCPMWDAWGIWKTGNRADAIDFIKGAEKLATFPIDWLVATRYWMERRVSRA